MIDMININAYYMVLFFRTIINTILVSSSLYISLRANRLHSLSSYKGFKIFRNAFFCYFVAFSLDYILFLTNSSYITSPALWLHNVLLFFFFFFIVAGGFYLVYSLVWKELEKSITFLKKDIFSNKDLLLVGDALVVTLLAMLVNEDILFIVVLLVLGYAATLSYNNYKKADKKNKYPQMYFISIVLAFMGYFLNYMVWFFPILKVYVLLITAFIFIIFLYGVIKSSKGVI